MRSRSNRGSAASMTMKNRSCVARRKLRGVRALVVHHGQTDVHAFVLEHRHAVELGTVLIGVVGRWLALRGIGKVALQPRSPQFLVTLVGEEDEFRLRPMDQIFARGQPYRSMAAKPLVHHKPYR